MKATRSNWNDIRKYYSGTFILVPEATHHVLHVDKVDESYIYVSDPNGDNGGIELTDKGYTILDILPRKQFFQFSDTQAAVIQRKPARMWKKGIHAENTCVFTIGENGGQSGQTVTHALIEKFQQNKGKFTSLDKLPVHGKSYALSERVCVTHDGKLLMDSFVVGMCSVKKKTLMPMKEFLPYLPTSASLWEIKTV